MVKVTLNVLATAALLVSVSALAEGDVSRNYISAGVHDQYDSSAYIEGAVGVGSDLAVGVHYNNAFDGFIKAEVQLHDHSGSYWLAGISNYKLLDVSKNGFYAGLMLNLPYTDDFSVLAGATYDTGMSGFFSLSAKGRYTVSGKAFVEAGYKLNTSGMDNELLFGVGVRF